MHLRSRAAQGTVALALGMCSSLVGSRSANAQAASGASAATASAATASAATASAPAPEFTEPEPAGPAPQPTPVPSASSVPLTQPVSAPSVVDAKAWQTQYEQARKALIDKHYAAAAEQLRALADKAPTPQDALLAKELALLADAQAVHEANVREQLLRSTDELALLYTGAFAYGLGTGAWFALLTKPGSLPAAVLPFLAFTTASVGGVAVVDSYAPFRRGVPQAISTGLLLGLGEGIWVVGLQHAYASNRGQTPWSGAAVATALWAGTSLGAVAGGLMGVVRHPTPGRASFTGSMTLWSGVISGLAGAAIERDVADRREVAFTVSAVGYNAGLVAAMVLAPRVEPSAARVRFIDLSGLGGGLLGVGGYLVAAGSDASPRAGFASGALGATAGLALGFWLTDDMPSDPKPKDDQSAWLSHITPIVQPVPGGFVAGIGSLL